MKLYTRAQNSAGERVRIALHLKRIEFEYVPVVSANTEEYRLHNPQGLIPTLEVDGVNLHQSLTIIEYIDELIPDPPLLPSDLLLKAKSRAFALAISAEAHALTVRRVRKYLTNQAGLPNCNVLGTGRTIALAPLRACL